MSNKKLFSLVFASFFVFALHGKDDFLSSKLQQAGEGYLAYNSAITKESGLFSGMLNTFSQPIKAGGSLQDGVELVRMRTRYKGLLFKGKMEVSAAKAATAIAAGSLGATLCHPAPKAAVVAMVSALFVYNLYTTMDMINKFEKMEEMERTLFEN